MAIIWLFPVFRAYVSAVTIILRLLHGTQTFSFLPFAADILKTAAFLSKASNVSVQYHKKYLRTVLDSTKNHFSLQIKTKDLFENCRISYLSCSENTRLIFKTGFVFSGCAMLFSAYKSFPVMCFVVFYTSSPWARIHLPLYHSKHKYSPRAITYLENVSVMLNMSIAADSGVRTV